MSFAQDASFRVKPMSNQGIASVASAFRDKILPGLDLCDIIDFIDLIDFRLPQAGIHVYAVRKEELPNSEAETLPLSDPVEILVRDELLEPIYRGGVQANRAKATVAHELGHACLHIDEMKSMSRLQLALRRQARDIAPYENSEWQAWTFAGHFVMPLAALVKIEKDPMVVAQAFGVSPAFAKSHMKRCKLIN